ncbi:MAG: helix-turn-helix transcriptional regulator [Planctomycetes bacterium]|nr:helix-turn-helix transcriptional regulator [Planctomycetota bacterium]MBI3846439.1 helix-turn-helix transcriptional regulator [Planctomycetota bacterium]
MTRPRQLEALVSPGRVEIVEQLQTGGPASVREMAKALGRSPHSLYYHVRTLLAVGIVRRSDTRRIGKRDESVYALAAERIVVERDPWSPTKATALARSAAAILRRAERNFCRASHDELAWTKSREPCAFFGSRKAWLTRDAIREIAGLVGRIEELLARENGRKEGRLHLWTFALAPLMQSSSRRKP